MIQPGVNEWKTEYLLRGSCSPIHVILSDRLTPEDEAVDPGIETEPTTGRESGNGQESEDFDEVFIDDQAVFGAGGLRHARPGGHREIEEENQSRRTQSGEAGEKAEDQQSSQDGQSPHGLHVNAGDFSGELRESTGAKLIEAEQLAGFGLEFGGDFIDGAGQLFMLLLDFGPGFFEMLAFECDFGGCQPLIVLFEHVFIDLDFADDRELFVPHPSTVLREEIFQFFLLNFEDAIDPLGLRFIEIAVVPDEVSHPGIEKSRLFLEIEFVETIGIVDHVPERAPERACGVLEIALCCPWFGGCLSADLPDPLIEHLPTDGETKKDDEDDGNERGTPNGMGIDRG